jgi:hypothetical protein
MKYIKIILIILSTNSYSQSLRNTIELGGLGNLGFINLGYNREILNFDKFNILTSLKIGYVPGSQETEKSAIPNFIHTNFGSSLNYNTYHSKFGVGISFSKILIGNDEFNKREKSNYSRLLGDVNYTYYFDITNEGKTGVKISYIPILYDNGADDMQNIPIGLSFLYEF